jgi:hypothetical protein
MGRQLYNTVTIIFLALSGIVLLVTVLMVARVVAPPASLSPRTPIPPTVISVPTSTITPTPTITPRPTDTPTLTPTITPSRTPVAAAPGGGDQTTGVAALITNTTTPSQTAFLIVQTESPTMLPTTLPTAFPTANPTATPTVPTPIPTALFNGTPVSALRFGVKPPFPQITERFGQTDCNFQGIAGLVFDANENTIGAESNIQAAVESVDPGFRQSVLIGTDPTYGWLIQVDLRTNNRRYTVELRDTQGIPISERIEIAFPNSCTGNLALVYFQVQQ